MEELPPGNLTHVLLGDLWEIYGKYGDLLETYGKYMVIYGCTTRPGKLTVCELENGHRNSGFTQLQNGDFS